MLNVLGLLIELEPAQAELLDEICAGPLVSAATLKQAGALEAPPKMKPAKRKRGAGRGLF